MVRPERFWHVGCYGLHVAIARTCFLVMVMRFSYLAVNFHLVVLVALERQYYKTLF